MKQTSNCSGFNATFPPSAFFRCGTYLQIKMKKLKILVGYKFASNTSNTIYRVIEFFATIVLISPYAHSCLLPFTYYLILLSRFVLYYVT